MVCKIVKYHYFFTVSRRFLVYNKDIHQMIYIPKWPTLHEFKCVYSVARGKHLLLSVSFRIDTRSPSVAEGNWNDVSSFARKICEWIPRLHLLNHKQIKDTHVQESNRMSDTDISSGEALRIHGLTSRLVSL